MLGWVFFYILSFSLLAGSKKLIAYLYPFFYWIFVGFRNNIGTDYPLNLVVVERSYRPFNEIAENFYGYNALDLEVLHKFIAMTMNSFMLPLQFYYVIVAGIEAIVMHFIFKNTRNTKLFLIYFICLFSINYAMNTARQGLCFIFIILAFLFENKKNISKHTKILSIVSYILAAASHYASLIIIMLSYVKIKKIRTYFFVFVLLLIVARFVDLDLLESRYGGAEKAYEFGGFGLRIYLFAFIVLYTSKKLIGEGVKTQDNIFLLILMLAIFISHPFVRLFFFYTYLLAFKCLIKADSGAITGVRFKTALIFPLIAFGFELLEIIRTPFISGAGVWFPYSNWLFNF
jgi:hypothetical protein